MRTLNSLNCQHALGTPCYIAEVDVFVVACWWFFVVFVADVVAAVVDDDDNDDDAVVGSGTG